jgi:hypothetical protein
MGTVSVPSISKRTRVLRESLMAVVACCGVVKESESKGQRAKYLPPCHLATSVDCHVEYSKRVVCLWSGHYRHCANNHKVARVHWPANQFSVVTSK